MAIHALLSTERIFLAENALSNRKRALQTLAGMLAGIKGSPSGQVILNHLLEREKLGSTALGNSVAVPHCRIADLEQPCAAFLRTIPGIDYDAPDHKPVNLLFALLVPENANEEHLHLLAELAEILTQGKVKDELMQGNDAGQIISILKNAYEYTSNSA